MIKLLFTEVLASQKQKDAGNPLPSNLKINGRSRLLYDLKREFTRLVRMWLLICSGVTRGLGQGNKSKPKGDYWPL